jgi:hypothetical protein
MNVIPAPACAKPEIRFGEGRQAGIQSGTLGHCESGHRLSPV